MINRKTPGNSTLAGSLPSGLTAPSGLAWDGTNLYCVDNTDNQLWLVDRTNPGNSTLVSALPSGLTDPLDLAWVETAPANIEREGTAENPQG